MDFRTIINDNNEKNNSQQLIALSRYFLDLCKVVSIVNALI